MVSGLIVPAKGGGGIRSIIEELYYGNITPSDRDIVRGSEYSHILQLLTRSKDELMQTLTQAQQEIFEKFKDCVSELNNGNELAALENVVMVGYPNGLYDTVNNYPLFRTGKTATHPAIDYNGKKKALLDMACLPGSSGSPVFILDEGWIHHKNGGMSAGSRILFLGIENSMPTRYSKSVYKKTIFPDGRIEYIKTEDYIIENDMKLGYYIKSSEISGFNVQIQNLGL